MGFSRQEYWSGLPFPSPGDLPDPGIKPGSPELQADLWATREALMACSVIWVFHVKKMATLCQAPHSDFGNGNRVIRTRLPVFHRARPLPFTSVPCVLNTFCVPCTAGDENVHEAPTLPAVNVRSMGDVDPCTVYPQRSREEGGRGEGQMRTREGEESWGSERHVRELGDPWEGSLTGSPLQTPLDAAQGDFFCIRVYLIRTLGNRRLWWLLLLHPFSLIRTMTFVNWKGPSPILLVTILNLPCQSNY